MAIQTSVSEPRVANKPRIARTRVKICGITREQDAASAIEAGADALGFVFYPPSPRAISAKRAAQICGSLPPLVDKVALFVNASSDEIRQLLDLVPITLIQFHGDETAEFCEQFARPYIKAIRIKAVSAGNSEDDMNHSPEAAVQQMLAHNHAAGFLLDAYHKGVPGGTGKTFDWNCIPVSERPLILAGGLTSSNVTDAITQVAPFAVDVSSGVESAPGIKDPAKIWQFMQAAQNS